MSDIIQADQIFRPYHVFDVDREIRTFDIKRFASQQLLSEKLLSDRKTLTWDVIQHALRAARLGVADALNREQSDMVGELRLEVVVRADCEAIDRAAGLDERQRFWVADRGFKQVRIAL